MVKKFLSRYFGFKKEIYVLFVSRIINCIGAFVHPLLTLILKNKLGMDEANVGWLMTLMLITQLPSMLIGGKLSDRFGRVKLVAIFQSLGAAIYIICGLLPMSTTVVVLILVASNFYALSYPSLDAMTMDLTNPKNRKEALSLIYMGINIGFAVGPMLGGMLFEKYLRWVFIGDAVTTMAAVVLIIIFIKETLPDKNDKKNKGLESYEKGSVFSILKDRMVIIAIAFILLLYQFAYSQFGFALPIQMDGIFGDKGAFHFGLLISFNGVLVIVLTPFVTYVLKKVRSLVGTLASGLLYAAAFTTLIFAKTLPVFYAAMFLMTLGEVALTIDAFAFIAGMSPSSHRARVNSVVNIIASIGRVISPFIIGQVIAHGGMGYGWLTVALVSLFGAILALVFMNIQKTRGIHDIIQT